VENDSRSNQDERTYRPEGDEKGFVYKSNIENKTSH